MFPPPAPRPLSDPRRALRCPLSLVFHNTDIGKRAMPIRVIQAVSHDPQVGDVDHEVIDFHVLLETLTVPHQDAGLQGGRFAREQDIQEVFERVPGVDDILDEQNVLPRDVRTEIHDEAHGPGRCGVLPVGGKGHEIDAPGDGEKPGKVGKENEAPPKNADQEQFLRLVVIRGLLTCQLPDPMPDLFLGNENRRRFWNHRDLPAPTPGFALPPFLRYPDPGAMRVSIIFSQLRTRQKTTERGTDAWAGRSRATSSTWRREESSPEGWSTKTAGSRGGNRSPGLSSGSFSPACSH